MFTYAFSETSRQSSNILKMYYHPLFINEEAPPFSQADFCLFYPINKKIRQVKNYSASAYDIAVGTLQNPMKKTAWVSKVHKIFWKETFEAQLFYDTYVKLFGNYVEVVGMGLHDERDEPCEFIKVISLLSL